MKFICLKYQIFNFFILLRILNTQDLNLSFISILENPFPPWNSNFNPLSSGKMTLVPNSRTVLYVDYTTLFSTIQTLTLVAADFPREQNGTTLAPVILDGISFNSNQTTGLFALFNYYYVAILNCQPQPTAYGPLSVPVCKDNFLSIYFLDVEQNKFIQVANYMVGLDNFSYYTILSMDYDVSSNKILLTAKW